MSKRVGIIVSILLTCGLAAARELYAQNAAGDLPFFDRSVTVGSIAYATAGAGGVYVSLDGGTSWRPRNEGLPHRMVYPFTEGRIETLTAIGMDPFDPRRAAVTTSLGLYVSDTAGLRWQEIPLVPPIKSVAYITSVAVSPWSHETYAVGTSFGGIFETTDGGRSWKNHNGGLGFLYRGAGFYEEIAGLAYSPIEPAVLFLGAGFGGGVYRSSTDKSAWTSLDFPAAANGTAQAASGGNDEVIRALSSGLAGGRPTLVVTTREHSWLHELDGPGWRAVAAVAAPPPIGETKAKRLAAATNRSGLYLAASNASGAPLQRMIARAKENDLNAFVVDVKDDFGHLTYDSHVSLARAIGAVRPAFDLRKLLAAAHANGIYVIGRMVVFKDEPLFRADRGKYAIWDVKTDSPWGEKVKEVEAESGHVRYVQKDFWVDPYAEAVWQYNVAIAEELQSLGIDEVQFDYIRFPSDGPLSEATYRYRRGTMSRIDALESFMVMARDALHVPISADLYGFNCWYRMGNWIGQDLEMLADYVDVVCPMYYPSLFPPGFMEHVPYLERAREIYYQGTRRAREIARGRADVRPFVQAFLLLDNEVQMDRATYGRYLRAQLSGARAAGSSGFTLWNAGSAYFMITSSLAPYVPARPSGGP